MKNKLIVLLFLFTTWHANAQIAWIRELPIDGTVNSIIKTFDGGYALLATTYENNNSFTNIIKYDKNGELQWLKTPTLKDDTDYSVWGFIQTTDNGYIMVGRSSFTPNDGECLIIKTNAFGDTIFTRSIYYENPPQVNRFIIPIEYSPGDYAVLGGKADYTNYEFYIHRFNAEGDLVQIDYEESFICPRDSFIFSKIAENRLLIAKSTETPNHYIKDYEYNTILARNHATVGGLHQDNQGNFFKLSETFFRSQGTNYNLPELYDEYLIKYNQDLDSLWSFNIDDYLENGVEYQYFSGMTATSDGGYAFCGEAWNDLFRAVYFIKTDEYGNMIDWAGYGAPYYPFQRVTGLIETPDGGFVMFVGTDLYSGDLYLIKTNTDGSLSTNDYKKDEFILTVYPNPCSDIVNISFCETFTGIVRITDINGQHLINANINNQTSETIDISNLITGIYFCNIFNETGNIIYIKKLIKL